MRFHKWRPGRASVWIIVLLALLSGCARPPPTQTTTLKPKSLPDLNATLLASKPDLELFRLRGPFAVTERKNHALRLSNTEIISADLYLASPGDKGPLVILLHGHDSTKEAHENQAVHLASWGLHALSVQLPKNGPWVAHGRTLARIASFIQRAPGVIDSRIDVNRIILVGHSFGASSVSVALAEGAPAAGAILLDPAAIGKELPKLLQRINKPVMVLGADDEVVGARNRDYFYRFVRSGVAEISIRDAAHEDAQYPSEFSLQNFGIDPYTTEELQITFMAALTSAAFSLAATGALDYAWTSYRGAVDTGKFFNARRK